MTGSRAAGPRSGDQTLTVSQSSGSPVPGGAETARPDGWGGGAPNVSAARMPSQGSAGSGDRKRKGPTGGRAKGMPRKTCRPPSERPVTRPVVVRTGGGTGASGAGAAMASGPSAGGGLEDDDRDLAAGLLLVLGEPGLQFLLPGPDRLPLLRVGHPGGPRDGLGADLEGGLGVGLQVVVPGRVVRGTGLGGEDRVAAVHRLVGQRGDPLLAGPGPGVVQQDQVVSGKRLDLAAVGAELVDDAGVPIIEFGHSR